MSSLSRGSRRRGPGPPAQAGGGGDSHHAVHQAPGAHQGPRAHQGIKGAVSFLTFCILHINPYSFSGRTPIPFTGFRTSPGDVLAWLHPLLAAPSARVGSAALAEGDMPVTQPKALPTARDGDHGANPAPFLRAGLAGGVQRMCVLMGCSLLSWQNLTALCCLKEI